MVKKHCLKLKIHNRLYHVLLQKKNLLIRFDLEIVSKFVHGRLVELLVGILFVMYIQPVDNLGIIHDSCRDSHLSLGCGIFFNQQNNTTKSVLKTKYGVLSLRW